MMTIGGALVFGPLAVIADVVPFIGDLVRTGVTLIAALVAGIGSALTISLAWLFYRPMIGVPLLILAIGLLIVLLVMKRRSATA